MGDRFDEYLENGTNRIKEIISSKNAGNTEKEDIIASFVNTLSSLAFKEEITEDSVALIDSISMRHIDDELADILAKTSFHVWELEKAIDLCERQKQNVSYYKRKNIQLPELKRPNIDDYPIRIRAEIDKKSHSNRVREYDNNLWEKYQYVQNNKDIKACEDALLILHSLKQLIDEHKKNKEDIKSLKCADLSAIENNIIALKKKYERMLVSEEEICEIDRKISSIEDRNNLTLSLCDEVIALCDKLEKAVAEYEKNYKTSIRISNTNRKSVIERYTHYKMMLRLDIVIGEGRVSHNTAFKYKRFVTNCEKQQNNIQICYSNGWKLPALVNKEIQYYLQSIKNEKEQKKKKLKRRAILILIIASVVVVAGLVGFFNIKHSIEYSTIECDSRAFLGRDYLEVEEYFKNKGFTNIVYKEDLCGWKRNNTVLGVTINSKSSFNNNDEFKKDALVQIRYSAGQRRNITDFLQNMKYKSPEELYKGLKDQGYVPELIVKKISDNTKHGKYDILIDGEEYLSGACYLTKEARIVINRYECWLKPGKSADEFKNREYLEVKQELEKQGFTNVALYRSNDLNTGDLIEVAERNHLPNLDHEGKVKEVIIGKDKNYSASDEFLFDTSIQIIVYTFSDGVYEDIKLEIDK